MGCLKWSFRLLVLLILVVLLAAGWLYRDPAELRLGPA